MHGRQWRCGAPVPLPAPYVRSLPAERHANRAAPEVEVAEPEIEVVVRFVVLKRTEVTQVAADADVVVEETVHASADVDTEVVGAELVEECRRANATADHPDTGG